MTLTRSNYSAMWLRNLDTHSYGKGYGKEEATYIRNGRIQNAY